METAQKEICELEKKKREWYNEAVNSGIIQKISAVCRGKGESVNNRYGPKYRLLIDDIEVFVDDYGRYMTVRSKGNLLCSTHYCDQLYRPGLWMQKILALHDEAVSISEKKAFDVLEKKRNDLRAQLGLVDEPSIVVHWTCGDVWELYKKSKELLNEVAMNDSGTRKKEQEAAWEGLYQLVTKLERKQ